jgi:hypothetical protein
MYNISYIEFVMLFTETRMPFREKIAWIALIGILGAALVYFGTLYARGADPEHFYFIGLFLKVTVVQTMITIAATVVTAILSRRDAGAPRDERDRLIDRNAAGLTYYPLLVGVILAAVSIHFGNGIFGMLNTLLGVIMAAEALRFALLIVGYRRGG